MSLRLLYLIFLRLVNLLLLLGGTAAAAMTPLAPVLLPLVAAALL